MERGVSSLDAAAPPTYVEAACARWDADARHTWPALHQRVGAYERATEALQGALRSCICPRANGGQGGACTRLLVLSRRIGSPSADAEVYETIIASRRPGQYGRLGSNTGPSADVVFSAALRAPDATRMAVKVLAVVSDDSAARNNSEMTIAQAASDLVRQGASPHFPLVYGTTYCDAVTYAPGSLLGAAARDYDLRQQVIDAAPPARRRQVRAIVRTTADLTAIADALEAYGLTIESLDPGRPLAAYLLVSEMAWGDLASLAARTDLTADQWFGIVRGVLMAVSVLQQHLSVVHNDLHFGNVLVALVATESDGGGGAAPTACTHMLLPLVHDFGRSYRVEVWLPDDRVRDAEKVVEGLLSQPRLPAAVRTAAEGLDSFIRSLHTRDYVMDQIVDAWAALALQGEGGTVLNGLDGEDAPRPRAWS
ncbi:hypothetical protein pneo_cds_67 [Pandoravirus neocaledonia]|uniref:Protein kinase domain-containing protein n=1 Tax=Pandoravirus neocaledonia TaxID=2107708 RepID=A0A2U7UB63_9VIRU|nr:hypothetical protein pneo_cds_67 [Pandoravirus neocaledonia]AVK75674.1 hypothetical protein pneo_cds_67 [Pandoravirus neocaledonia]